VSEVVRISGSHKLAEFTDRPSFGNSIELGSQDRSAASMGLKNNRGEGFGRDLRVNKAVEGMVKGYRIRLLADEAGAIFQAEVANVVSEQSIHRAGSCEKKAGVRKTAHDHLSRLEKNPLSFSDGEIKSADDTEDELVLVQAELMPGGGGVGGARGVKEGGVDSGMNDVEFFWGNNAGRAMMSFWHGRGRVVVSLEKDLGDKGRDGDNGVRLCEQMFSADRGSGAFGKVTREDYQWAWLNETGGEKSSPVIIAMVGMENPGFYSTEDPGEGDNLIRSKTGERVEAEFLGGGGKGSIDGASHFDRPAQMGKALGESEALGIGATPLKSGVELKNSGGKRGRRHRFDSRGNKRVVTSRGRKKDFQFLSRTFRTEH
jgi:hypothetical protein